MGIKTVLVDDLDGTELPADTPPVVFTLGRTQYSLYLSEDNHGKLMSALEPFIEGADKSTISTGAPSSRARTRTDSADKEKMKAVREWAQSTGFKFKDAQGNEKTLGDRGRIPDEVVKAYEEAN